MGLLSFLKRKSGDAPVPRPAAATDSVDSVQQARTRARQRLIGSVVLVAAGVVGFPLLFETQPRPLPGDTPIEVARKDGAAPVVTSRAPAVPRATVSPPPTVISEGPADAGREVAPVASAPTASAVAAPAVAKPPEPKPEARPEPRPEPKPTAKPEVRGTSESARAQALLEAKPTAAASKPSVGEGRYVVQVGAFAEVTAAREARQKVEKLGMKTYTQVVETSSGKRIRVRVGPFATREEADKASARIKSAGLGSAVYTL